MTWTWWARRHPAVKALLVLTAAWAAVITLLGGAGAVLGGGDQAGSSLSTSSDGYAGMAALLMQVGHPVDQARTRLDRVNLGPSATVVIVNEILSPSERAALGSFVNDGGRLVSVGNETPLVTGLVDPALQWSAVGPSGSLPVSSGLPETSGVSRITLGGQGSWTALGRAQAVAPSGGPPVEAVATVGRGTVVMVADATMWEDDLLARTDNALVALDAVGAQQRRVIFAEGERTGGSGLAALPAAWRWAAALLVLAWLTLVWGRGKRFGPAESDPVPTAPSRARYVTGLAAALRRSRQPATAVRLLRDNLSDHPAGDAPLPPEEDRDANERELLRLARRAAGKVGSPT